MKYQRLSTYVLLCLSVGAAQSHADQLVKPNVVFILADDKY